MVGVVCHWGAPISLVLMILNVIGGGNVLVCRALWNQGARLDMFVLSKASGVKDFAC